MEGGIDEGREVGTQGGRKGPGGMESVHRWQDGLGSLK